LFNEETSNVQACRHNYITLNTCLTKTGFFSEPTHYTADSFQLHQQSIEENTLFRVISIAAI